VPASGQSSRGMALNIFGNQRQQTLVVAAAHCRKKPFTIWTFSRVTLSFIALSLRI
jgi:hypothetical protein